MDFDPEGNESGVPVGRVPRRRFPGDAPGLENATRLRRMHPPGVVRGRRRSGRRSGSRRSSTARNQLMLWVVLFSLLSVAVVGSTIYLWLRKSSARQQKFVERPQVERRVVSRFPSPSQDEALAIVKGGLGIGSEQEVLRYFRAPGRTASEVFEFVSGYRKQFPPDPAAVRYAWLSSIDANGLLLDGVAVLAPGGQGMKRLALLTPDDEGVWRIDFDAFARTCEPPFETLLEQEQSSGLVRVMVVPDNYFIGPFADESEWMSFSLGSPDLAKPLRGYCLRNSPTERALHEIIVKSVASNAGPPRIVARIIRRATLGDPLFEITEVHAEDWVLAPRRFDQKFD